MRPRVGLAALMAGIALLALGLGAFLSASEAAAKAVVLVSIVALLAAMVGARVGPRKAAWAGFATFGQGYVLLIAISMAVPHLLLTARGIGSDAFARLQPTELVVGLADLSRPVPPALPSLKLILPIHADAFAQEQARQATRQEAIRAHSAAIWIGLAIQGLIFAAIGALLGRRLARADRPPTGICALPPAPGDRP